MGRKAGSADEGGKGKKRGTQQSHSGQQDMIHSEIGAEAALKAYPPSDIIEVEMVAVAKDGEHVRQTMPMSRKFFDFLFERAELDRYFEDKGWIDEGEDNRFQTYSKDCDGHRVIINQRKDGRWIGSFGHNKFNSPPKWMNSNPRVLQERLDEFINEFKVNPELREETERKGNWYLYTPEYEKERSNKLRDEDRTNHQEISNQLHALKDLLLELGIYKEGQVSPIYFFYNPNTKEFELETTSGDIIATCTDFEEMKSMIRKFHADGTFEQWTVRKGT
ncbi:MAG: hypothetical protein FWG02_05230 [Holophagaceae bacterium]|nr:hypothetical protein [Holophagaceae bacterium]